MADFTFILSRDLCTIECQKDSPAFDALVTLACSHPGPFLLRNGFLTVDPAHAEDIAAELEELGFTTEL